MAGREKNGLPRKNSRENDLEEIIEGLKNGHRFSEAERVPCPLPQDSGWSTDFLESVKR